MLLATKIDYLTMPVWQYFCCTPTRAKNLNFLRATCIFNYVDVLTYLGVIKSNRSIQSARICFALFTMWMVGSGIMHVIEHLGDFWEDTPHDGSWSYFEACYFLLVTLSTVGYGDYVTHTALGKLFICIFIPVAMVDRMSHYLRDVNLQILKGRRQTLWNPNHVLVCGNFDNGSLRAFIKGFLTGGGAKGRVRLNMVILRPHYHAWVRYFVGTPNNPQDLARAKMQDARAAIVLATPNAKRRDADDAANIMQAISLKARKKTLRVVVQLHNFRNKCLINNFPRWTYLVNDMVVCMEELKLGLMAYNCMAPGFATLVLNLLNIHGSKCISKTSLSQGHSLAADFMATFFLYEKWNVVLVAVRSSEVDKSKMIINPIEKNCVVSPSKMRAIVIARDYSDALQLQDYCTSCLSHLTGHRCSCRKPERTRRQKVTIERDLALYEKMGRTRQLEGLSKLFDSPVDDESFETVPSYYRHSIAVLGPIGPTDQRNLHAMFNGGTFAGPDRSGFRFASVKLKRKRLELEAPCAYEARDTDPPLSPGFRFYQSRVNKVDRTGSFHWAPDMPYSKATLVCFNCVTLPCTHAQHSEDGAFSCQHPVKRENFQFNNHILVCVVSTTTNSPLNLENFIMPLRFHWKQIQDIVILGNSQLIGQQEWDKLKNFPRIFIVHGDPCSFTDLYAVQLSKCNACVILGDTNEELDSQSVDICLQDQKTLLCAMNIRSLLQRERHLVHLTTELRYERNAHLFSSVETHENDYKLPVWFNEPFARGFIFSNSLLYSCLSSRAFGERLEQLTKQKTLFQHFGLQEGLPDQTYRMPGVNVVLRGFDDPPFCFMANEQRRVSHIGLYIIRCEFSLEVNIEGFYCFMPITKTDQPESFPFGTPPKLMLSPTIWKPQTTTRMELK
ncbi:Calcium-activated potassium channel subunit alpha-1 [Fasciola gigantica]|uniref:Calcium-activated potassium channel subunit alpha-1 n=1 Tax=Fasciola gigantica TaxID=46835 RepID=A0A504Z1Y3_FASGI|nr:Calcium-activated potassium channel subunit alpha-1 [Fasciola gigantica]